MLNAYLTRAGITTGPLSKPTSHSALDRLKKFLLGLPQFKGGEGFLNFGVALHEGFLLGRFGTEYSKLTEEEQHRVDTMVAKLKRHPVVKDLYNNSVREIKETGSLQGVPFTYILDIKQRQLKRGSDLKTTSCRSLAEFIAQAKTLGYFRQSKSYKLVEKLDNFYYIGIQKQRPHEIYILDCANFKEDEAYAAAELQFLLYFYKNYGRITDRLLYGEGAGQKVQRAPTTNLTNKMPKTGKEALAEIKELAKLKNVADKESKKAQEKALRAAQALKRSIEKFPAKEKELYTEQLAKFTA